MKENDVIKSNEQNKDVWNTNASYWDKRMGDGNDWFEKLVWPATETLLELKPGDMVLDIACGNGLTSRKMALLGARIIAFDFSENMIKHARKRTSRNNTSIQYLVIDAIDENALIELGERRFDVALCNMALFDIANINPLIRALSKILKSEGKFVFSVLHPCFNNQYVVKVAEMQEVGDQIQQTYSVKVTRYLTSSISEGISMIGQPKPQVYYHRPLQTILNICFNAGFVMDAFKETSFPPDYQTGTFSLSWSGNYSEIPPVLIARMRL